MTNKLYRWATRCFTLHPLLLFGIIYVLFLVKSFFFLDPDFGWHISSGQYILEHGVPSHDIYSYTMPTFPWIHHEWLADTGNYLVYHYLGGYTALAVLYAGLWTAALWLITHAAKQRLLILFAAILILPFAGIRAITWSMVFSAILIRLSNAQSDRARWCIPAIMLLWANMHGSFVVGLAYLAWRWLTKRELTSGLILLTSVAVSIITPYGAGMYVEVFRTMTDASLHTNISEWMPLQLSLGIGIFTGIWFAMLVFEKRPWHKKIIRFETLLLLMALSSVRQAPLFVLFALPTVLAGIKKLPKPTITASVKRMIIAAVVLLLSVNIVLAAVEMHTSVSLDRESGYPSAIAAKLRAEPCNGNVFAGYNYGGYLIWKVPGEKLFIDGRMPSWSLNGDDIMADYIKITKSPSFRQQEFARYHITCVVWDGRATFTQQLQKSGWKVTQTESTNHIVLLEQ